ncbi:MAG: hypothetical protein VXZ04_02550 [Candidatus Thermoplasmatota archaeon]|jgi:hypothetical protein|nr:hypothetical protein [Candidatus Thermoplasmatota archaeon]MEC7504812.1 hypothetical protein [Candidatus Thermoplasmatota archaeon]MEC8415508.1 hypothetical protein [Candidatus Thermoplasmatota archaeon]MED6318670.1 hypothetical protein [Candidatus Thermoplasmatota archaeon]
MKHILPMLITVALLSCVPVSQAQDMQGPSWEMGWVTDVDPKYVVDLEDDWDLTGELVVFVSNDGPAALNLDITYDYDEDGPFSFDGPDSIEVAGNTNDTFRISITGAESDVVRAFSPSSSVELVVLGEEKVGDSTLRSQEVSADVTVPRMYRLMPNAVAPTDVLFAGSWVDFTLEVSNLGNTQDAITTGEATVRSCPHLTVTGLDQLDDTVVQVTNANGDNKATFTLRLEASSSHQERTCEVSIAVESEGDNTQRSSTFNVDVKAPSTDEPVVSEDDVNEGDAGSLSTSDSLPWLSTSEAVVALLLAWMVVGRKHG